jgi:hypothetical protein
VDHPFLGKLFTVKLAMNFVYISYMRMHSNLIALALVHSIATVSSLKPPAPEHRNRPVRSRFAP